MAGLRALLIAAALCVSLTGVSYARWTDRTLAFASVSTGAIDAEFSATQPCALRLVSGDGADARSAASGGMTCQTDGSGKRARVTVDAAFDLSKLAQEGTRLELEITLVPGAESSFAALIPPQGLPPAQPERVTLVPGEPKLCVGGHILPVPPELRGWVTPLECVATRTAERLGTGIVLTTSLQLTPDSASKVGNAPVPVIPAEGLPEEALLGMPVSEDGTSGELSAVLSARYAFELTAYVDQNRQSQGM